MSFAAIVEALDAFVVASCLFAMIKGGVAERLGAAAILGNVAFGAANELLLQSQVVVLTLDAVTALILLGVALRYAMPWLGVMMLLYAVQFALHAFYFVLERPRDTLHVIINNLDFFAVGLCLAIGTASGWARRRKTAGNEAVLAEAAP